jgi:hypothetical protein
VSELSARDRSKTAEADVRSGDRWLVGLVVFLIAIVLVACFIGWTAISRQARATCYQLTSVESAIVAENRLAASADDPGEHKTHVDRAAGLRVYAAGLRAIVPSCPAPSKPTG